jgi:hypothetical protein
MNALRWRSPRRWVPRRRDVTCQSRALPPQEPIASAANSSRVGRGGPRERHAMPAHRRRQPVSGLARSAWMMPRGAGAAAPGPGGPVGQIDRGGKLFSKIVGLPEPNDPLGKPKVCSKFRSRRPRCVVGRPRRWRRTWGGGGRKTAAARAGHEPALDIGRIEEAQAEGREEHLS